MRDDGEDVPAGEDAEGAGDAGDADDLRGLSAAALLAGAREAHAREQRQAGVTTAERVRLGQWLAAIKRREAFRAEGCASLAAWAQEKLKIRTAMTERYVRIAVLPVALVAQHDLGVSKLSRLVGCPEPVLAGLLPLASGWTEPVLAVAVTAARRVYGRSHDDVAALAAAQASAAQAVARALELRAAKGRTRRRGGALDAVTVVRQAIEAIKAKIAEAREKDPAVCAELAPRLHEVHLGRLGRAAVGRAHGDATDPLPHSARACARIAAARSYSLHWHSLNTTTAGKQRALQEQGAA